MALIPSQQGGGNQNAIPGFAANMYNRPTIVPIVGVNGQGQSIMETDPYFAIETSTVDVVSGLTEFVLFDASRLYQLSMNFSLPLTAEIIGKTGDYQQILNDNAQIGSYFDIIKMRVVYEADPTLNDVKAQAQFANPIDIYQTGKSKPRLIRTIYPEMGIHEGQFQLSINTFGSLNTMTNRHAFVFKQEPGIRLFWGFYQKAEIGRQQ